MIWKREVDRGDIEGRERERKKENKKRRKNVDNQRMTVTCLLFILLLVYCPSKNPSGSTTSHSSSLAQSWAAKTKKAWSQSLRHSRHEYGLG